MSQQVDAQNNQYVAEQNLAVLSHIIENIPYYVFWKDKELIFGGCNRLFAEQFGYISAEQVIGKTDHDFGWSTELKEKYLADDQQIINTGFAKLNYEEEQRQPDGSIKTVLVNKLPIYNQKGKTAGILGFYTDITERKKSEYALRQAKDRAEQADKAKTEFIRNISHDIRTPLTGIIGTADLFAQQTPDLALQGLAHDITAASKSLLYLLNEVIEVAQIEIGDIPNLHKKFSLKKLILEVFKLFSPKIKAKTLAFDFSIDEAIPEYVISNNFHIHRILICLLSNAIKFTPEGAISLRVHLLEKTAEQLIVQFTIADTGIGIPEDKQEVIFEKFNRLTPSYEGHYRGRGLGLYVISQLLMQLNGEIYVESEVHKGSTFDCIIPLKRSLTENTDIGVKTILYPEMTDMLNQPTSTPEPNVSHQMLAFDNQAPKDDSWILVVEDNLLAQRVIVSNLNSWGYNVQVVSNGLEAINISQQQAFDLIYMDIGLPDTNGMDVTRKIRNDKDNPNAQTPIVALTAHADALIEAECLEAGMRYVITKPLTKEKATEIFAKYLPTHHQLPIIDLELGTSLMNNNATVAKEMLDYLVSELPTTKALLTSLFKNNNWPELKNQVHKLRGALCYCGVPRLKFVADNLEVALQNNEAKIHGVYASLMREIDNLLTTTSLKGG